MYAENIILKKRKEERTMAKNYTPVYKARVNWDLIVDRLKEKGYSAHSFSMDMGYNRNWISVNKLRNAEIKKRDILCIASMLDLEPEDIIIVPEPEPEPEPIVEEPVVEEVPDAVSTSFDPEFQQWIKDAYMQLHKDNLAIIEAIRSSSTDKVNMLVCLNNNINQLRKLLE